MTTRPRLQVACNNPDNGLFDYRAPLLKVFDAELEGWTSAGGPTFHELWRLKGQEDRSAIRLAGKVWPVNGTRDWVGNWCWNEYALGDGTKTAGWWMVDFLKWLRGRKLYQCTHGTTDFCAWFNGGAGASPAEIHTMIYEQRFS